VVVPVSPSGGALVNAVVNITCSGIPIASGVGQQTVVVPIPSSGSITCTITGSSNGKAAATTVTLTSSQAGQVITRTLVIPVSEYYTPNMGFIMLITVIALLVAVLAVLIVVILRLRR
jgi:Na+/melibiose symporter-like transporter